MTNSKNTRRALLGAVLSLIICVSMLVGTTFAWFTDTTSTAVNSVQSGTLDIELQYQKADGSWANAEGITLSFKKAANAPADEQILWEPGCTYELPAVKVVNKGNLAVKYEIAISGIDGDAKLNEVIDWTYNGEADLTASGSLLANAESAPITIKGHMQETAGNEYQNLTIDGIAITVFATQLAHEYDSFGNQYDADSQYPIFTSNKKVDDTPLALNVGDFNVLVPASAPLGTYAIEIRNIFKYDNGDNRSLTFNLNIVQDIVSRDTTNELLFDVSVNIGSFFNILNVKNIGNSPASVSDISYANQDVTFRTNGSGTFEITYKSAGENMAVSDDGKLIGGVFKGVNPATFDPSLAETGSEYIAINYQKDGETYYTIAKRSTTVIVAADFATDYSATNGNYTVATNQSGKLWSIISGLQNQEHTTLYLLPGTYNEGTTINVYSSMDIIGLGDKDTVKIIKQSSSNSNRHLFNCNGTKSDYINVSLRNLYLDATANTEGGKDNAAVQVIRKSKVKCYDLTIVKNPTSFSAVAFYVNGNNTVDGVKYPVYMYVENCSLNTTNTFGVLTTSGTYKFYHSGLTYNGTAYTTNSGSKLNKVMEPTDWEW